MKLGDLEAAQKSFENDLAINQKLYGEVHPNIAAASINLGKIKMKIGGLKDLEEARLNFERALDINKKYYKEYGS